MAFVINRRLISSLLGGGVTATLATVGGIKANETITYNRQIGSYNELSDNFGKKRASIENGLLKNQYLPKWHEDSYWKLLYEGRLSQRDGGEGQAQKNKEFKESYPTIEAFKEYCFAEAKKDPDLAKVNPSQDWGGNCLLDETALRK